VSEAPGNLEVRIHPHCAERAAERGATEAEIEATVRTGERIPAKHGREGFRRAFPGPWPRRRRTYPAKQLLVYAAETPDGWLAVTVIVKYLGRTANAPDL
jgi:hypothetical protein